MKLNPYQKTAITTVFATLFLIFVGGLVRATGAGLGCPDWPKCFGTWIPPTSLAGLSPKFDPSQFNVWKTWIEYINRLVGAIIGLLIIATFMRSFRYRVGKPGVFYSSIVALLLVLVQGWLGGQVVKSGLSEWMITIHMILALVIVNILLYAAFKSTSEFLTIRLSESSRCVLYRTGVVLLILTLIQLVIGTQVREAVDVIKEAANPLERSTWIGNIGTIFLVHRSYSWLLLVSGAFLGCKLFKVEKKGLITKIGYANIGLIMLQILVGIGLEFLDMPPAFQVIHLVGIALMVSGQFLFLLIIQLRTE